MKKKPGPTRSKPKEIDQGEGREVVYTTPESTFYDSTGPKGLADCIDHLTARKWLGWETEKDFVARMKREHPKLKNPVPSLRVGGKDVPVGWTLRDHNGENVVCWNNLLNRPFKQPVTEKYEQEVLSRRWAGPLTFPGQTVNGEGIIIGRTGLVISGQKRLVAVVFAHQKWAGKNGGHWKDVWPEKDYPNGPVMESLVVTGVSESHLIVRTVDNVDPRSLGDVVYTSPLFRDLGQEQKAKASRMMANATAFLWRRTRPRTAHDGLHPDPYTVYRTHPASEDFIDRHPRLVEAVRLLLGLEEAEKTRRVISATLRLSAGECAGMLYLMASSDSDAESYRGLDPEPAEKALTFGKDDSGWELACKFWVHVANDNVPGDPKCVRFALGQLADPLVPGVSERAYEKYAVVSRAWAAFKEEGKVFTSDLFMPPEKGVKGRMLKGYEPDPAVEGRYKMVSDARSDFGGIDLGDQAPGDRGEVVEPTADQVEELRNRVKEVRRRGVKGPEGTADVEARRDSYAGGGKGTGTVPRMPGEVACPPKVAYDADGKPPVPTKKPAKSDDDTPPVPGRRKAKPKAKKPDAAPVPAPDLQVPESLTDAFDGGVDPTPDGPF